LARELADSLPEPCRPDFLRLTRSLLHGPRFQWLLAEAPDDVLRERLLLALDRVLRQAGLHSSRLPVDRTIPDVSALETALQRHAKGCTVVHVLAQRGWFDSAHWEAFNVRRERLASSAPARLLFWLDAEAIEAAANGAPDLWAWRAGVYSFRTEQPLTVLPQGVRSVSHTPSTNSAPPDVRTLQERRERVAELQQWFNASPPPDDEAQVGPVDELGRLLASLGDYDAALQHWLTVALPLHLRRGDAWAQAVTRGQIADILQARGQLDEVLRIRQEEQLPVFKRLGDERSVAITRGQIADILQVRGQLDEALRIRQEQELPVYERLGDVHSAAITRGLIADIWKAWGQLDEALRIRQEYELPVYERLGDVRSAAITRSQIADILQARGQLDEALHIREEVLLPVFERLGDVRSAAITWGKIADILQARGQLDEALRIRQENELPVYERLGDVREAAVTWVKIAFQRFDAGEHEAAQALFKNALAVFERLGLPDAERLRQVLKQRGITL
jgi:tetratricopeptide (TPR) repeat protein